MKRLFLTGLLGLICAAAVSAEEQKIASPDGKLVVTVTDEGGKPSYGITYNGVVFLEKSPLGLDLNVGDYTEGITIKAEGEAKQVPVQYSLRNIKKSEVNHMSNEQELLCYQDDRHVYSILFHVDNNNVAYRYKLVPKGPTRSCVVKEEATGFVMPEGTTTFLCPQSGPMGGFARTSPSYETGYTVDDTMGKNGWGNGYSFPCLFKNGEKGWILISETGTDGNYCACRLLAGEDGLYTIGFPQEGEMNGLGSTTPGIAMDGATPWRTITVGETLAPIMETTISFDVVKPKYEASKEYEYGKGHWSWIIGMDGATNYDEQIRYIDFAAAMGYTSILVDALWDTQIGYDRIEELAKYGASKGVDLFLWYNSNGYWNDAPQGPRHKMDNHINRSKEMAWMKSIGVRGIKVDFFGGDKQMTMQLYEDILADANEYGLLVIFHGCTLPRGWDRMYPNFAASEAVLASENLHFSQGSCDAEAFNACLHPFIRNTVGSMDFGGSALNKYYNAKNEPRGSKRMTSDVFALATAVMFQSPVQHFALAPNNLTDAPAWAIKFMKDVPTTWDDIKFIDGYPGKYVIMARRHGDNWYVVGVNAEKETLKVKVQLPMFEQGAELQVYSDDEQLQGSVKTKKMNKKQEMELVIPCNGGIVVTK